MLPPLRAAIAAAAAMGALHAVAADGTAPDARASTWVGSEVRDGQGRTIGRVSEVWLDMGRREPAVLTIAPAGGGVASACRLGRGGLEVHLRTFIVPLPSPGRSAPCVASIRDLPAAASYESTKALLGATIKSPDGDDVGKVKDVVVHATAGRVHYVLADFASTWVADGQLTILPARPLRRERDNVWMSADLNELQSLPMVAVERIGDVSNPSFAKAVDAYIAKR